MDEVRISNVARSAHWIKLDDESQKARAKLVSYGPGDDEGVTPAKTTS